MSSGSYQVRRTFRVTELGTVELLQRLAGYNTYHLRIRGSDTSHPLRISNHDARALLDGASSELVLQRYMKALR